MHGLPWPQVLGSLLNKQLSLSFSLFLHVETLAKSGSCRFHTRGGSWTFGNMLFQKSKGLSKTKFSRFWDSWSGPAKIRRAGQKNGGRSYPGALVPGPQGCGQQRCIQPKYETAHLGLAGRLSDDLELQAAATRLSLLRPPGATLFCSHRSCHSSRGVRHGETSHARITGLMAPLAGDLPKGARSASTDALLQRGHCWLRIQRKHSGLTASVRL